MATVATPAVSYLNEVLNLLVSLGTVSSGQVRARVNSTKEALTNLKAEVEKLEKDQDALKLLQEERATWQATEKARQRLQAKFEGMHNAAAGDDAVDFVFPGVEDGSPEIAITCSRTLVSKWSPAMEALVRHCNNLASDKPKQIRLTETAASVFQAARDFMCSGKLCASIVDGEGCGHTLLEFADRYGLQELKDEYVALVVEKKPVELSTAAYHLKLATKGNVASLREAALAFLASNIQEAAAQEQFISLDVEYASMVLAHHDLQLPGGRESETLRLVKTWIGDKEERTPLVGRLLQSVRFSLLGFMDLTDLQEEAMSNVLLADAKEELCAAIHSALNEKFGDVPLVESPPSCRATATSKRSPGSARTPTLKRKATVLVEGPEEERLGKVLRIARAMYSGA